MTFPLTDMRRTKLKLAIGQNILAMSLVACALTLGSRQAAGQASSSDGSAAAASATDSTPSDDGVESVEIDVPLLERQPFDRITLDAANQNALIETVVLDLPNRQVPNPLPTTGSLDVRRLSHPTIPYTVDWGAIVKVELFEQMLLAEAERLTAAEKFGEAFDNLAFLTTNYPQLPGLEEALQSHLWREASTAYAAKKREEAWPALVALYQRNPDYPRLINAVQAVSDDLISERMQEKDYVAARTLVEAIGRNFPKLSLTNVARWRGRFRSDADLQLARARQAFNAKQYGEARDAIAFARSIEPDIPGGAELWQQIQSSAPEIRVGVTASAEAAVMSKTPTWAVARVSDLINPRLVELIDFGAEGGVYASNWSELQGSDDGLRTTITLTPQAFARGLRPNALALRLVEMAGRSGDRAQEDFAALTAGVNLAKGRNVEVLWRRPHVRPESFLQIPLRWLTTASDAPGLWFDPQPAKRNGLERSFERTGLPSIAPGEPRLIVEMQFSDDEETLDALMRGDVDVIDRVSPWQLASVQNSPQITVLPYRLPTIHVLIPNPANPLLEIREFRRALNYGIDAESIVKDILLAGETRAGFRTLSGPFPAGVALNDPGGYAYNQELAPRPYEPRLAALLAGVARTTLTKREQEKQKGAEAAKAKELAESQEKKTEEDDAQNKDSNAAANAKSDAAATDDQKPDEEAVPPTPPLILAHASDPIAKLACQTIKIQLDQIGIPIKLAEFKGSAPPAELNYDLLYAELAVWEPVYDARRLLGSSGVAGRASAMMAAALDQLDRAENWNQARDQLREIHRIAHYDLPLIPLWQTVNHFAHRKSLSGVAPHPVTLYQRVSSWRKSLE